MAKEKSFVDRLLDDYGDFIFAREYKDGHPSISTGSASLDISTGIGGVPFGRFTEIYGPDMSGKTTLCLQICRNALAMGHKAIYIDVEHSLNMDRVKNIVGDEYTSDFLIVNPISGEDAFEISEMAIDSGYRCIIFDSIGAIASETELDEDSYEKNFVGQASKLTAKFLRKTSGKVMANEVAFVFVNQVRADIGNTYVKSLITPAGYALRHFVSLRISLFKGKEITKDDISVGTHISFTVKKNKLGPPNRQYEYPLYFSTGVDRNVDLIKFATMLGVVKQRGSYYVFDDVTLGQGIEKAAESASQEALDKIEEMCYNIANVKFPPQRKGFLDGHVES